MQSNSNEPVQDIKRLQRCMNDLVSILALPVVWSGREPTEILTTFVDSLVGMLGLDFLYAQVVADVGAAPFEVRRIHAPDSTISSRDELIQVLDDWLKEDQKEWNAQIRRRLGDLEISIFAMRMGLEGELGFIAAGSRKPSFPEQTERLILNVAVNQATIGIHQAKLLGEQKRVAGELEVRVAQRTSDLEAANEVLRNEIAERKAIEERLRESEYESRLIIDSIPGLTAAMSASGELEFLSQPILDYYGKTLEEVTLWTTSDLIHPEDRPRLIGALTHSMAVGDPLEIELRCKRFDGAYRWFVLRGRPLRDRQGHIVRWYLLQTDIDDRKRAEDELKNSERNFKRIIDTIPTLSWCNLPDGPNEFLSRNWHEYTGVPPEEAHGWGWQVTFHPDDLPPLMTKWQVMLTSGEPGEIEARIRRYDGVYRWFLIRAEPFRDESGKILRWYGTSTDIHDRKLADEALRASERNLRQIVDSIPGLVCTMNATGEIEQLNRPLREYFGKTSDELRDWRMTDAVHPDDLPEVIKTYTYSITTGTPYAIEHRCRRADGVYRWFQVRALAVHDTDNKVCGWYVLLTDIEDRKRAEDELKLSEARHRVIVETANDAVISIDESGVIILANPATQRIFGYDSADLIGKPLTSLMPEAMGHLHCAGFARYLETGQRRLDWRGMEFTARRDNGEEFPVEVSFGEMTAGEQRVFTGFIRDISEKKRAEETVRASERNLSLTINTMPALAWSARPDGSVEFFNQRWLNYTGMSAVDALGWGWIKAFHADDLDRVVPYWQSVLSNGEPGAIEVRVRQFDGNYRWFLIRANPLRDESGAIVKWYGTNTDIDDLKRAEEQLRRSEAFLVEGQRLSRTGTFCWRVMTNEIIWSEELLHIFSFAPKTPVTLELIGSRIHPEDIPVMKDMVATAQRAESGFEYEHRIVVPDGSIKHIHLIGHAVYDAQGRLEYFGAAQEITQRHLAEEALSKARSELARVTRITSLGVLTASIAHEVNQPLSGIITNAGTCLRMLNSEPPNVEGARETARRTIRDGNRASDVIARLRALFNKKEPTAEPVDLNEATREVIALSLSELQRSRVILQLELAERLPLLKGDRIQLQQVILNLVRNAVDAMSAIEDRPKRLQIRTAQDGENVRVTVQDSGTGVVPEAAERLFESFYSTKQDGMGIGLSVSRSIVEAHNGRLWVTENNGPGAAFAFSIPCRYLN